MTDTQIKEQIEMIEKLTAKATQSKESALYYLQKAGILDLIREPSEPKNELKK